MTVTAKPHTPGISGGEVRETRLAPEMSLVEIAEPFAKGAVWRSLDPRRLQRRLWRQVMDRAPLFTQLPDLAVSIADKINSGQVSLEVELRNLPPAVRQLRGSLSRLALSVIVSSLLLAGALLPGQQQKSFLIGAHIPEAVFGLAFIFSILLILITLFWPQS